MNFKNLTLIFAALTVATVAAGAEYTGLIIGVTDGDTVKVLDSKKVTHVIRLAGIDAPEYKQAYGRASRNALVAVVAGKTVMVVTHKRDKYKREVGKVIVDGADVNLQQIQQGMAWLYRDYLRELSLEDRRLYDAAETEAKASKLGLWKDAKPMPPWEFRRLKKNG